MAIKAFIRGVRNPGATLHITVSFENTKNPSEPFVKEYSISKAYGPEKIFARIKKDLNLFRKHDQTATKIEKLIDKEISL